MTGLNAIPERIEPMTTKAAKAISTTGSVNRTKLFIGTYTIKQLNENGRLETHTINVPDEIY